MNDQRQVCSLPGHLCLPRSAGLAAGQRPPGPHQLGYPPPSQPRALARRPAPELRLHRSAPTSPAIRWRRSCGQRRRTPSASARRLPRRRQRQAGSPSTQPPPRGLQAKPDSLLGVFQLSRPAAQPAHAHSHATPPHTAANQALGTLQGPTSAIQQHALR